MTIEDKYLLNKTGKIVEIASRHIVREDLTDMEIEDIQFLLSISIDALESIKDSSKNV